MSPHTGHSMFDKLMLDRLARLPVRVSKSSHSTRMFKQELCHHSRYDDAAVLGFSSISNELKPHHPQPVRGGVLVCHPPPRQPWYRPPPGPPPATRVQPSQPRTVPTVQAVGTASEQIQLVLEHHLHLWKANKAAGWSVDWAAMNMARRGQLVHGGGRRCVDSARRTGHGQPVSVQKYPGEVFNNNLPMVYNKPPAVVQTPAHLCSISSPPSIMDSGCNMSIEFSPSSSMRSGPGEGLGYVEEIDQFLDNFEFGPQDFSIDTSTSIEEDMIGIFSQVKEQAVINNNAVVENQKKVNADEETIDNIEECVRMLASNNNLDTTQKSQETVQYIVNGESFTVMHLDPIFNLV